MSETHAHSVAYVRTETLPELPPPASEAGLVKWPRENLFSSIPNGILTILSLWAIYMILAGVIPWITNGVWGASNIRECRELLNGATGGGCAVRVWVIF